MISEQHLAPAALDSPAARARLVETVAPLVFRTDLEAPGFMLLDLGREHSPEGFRAHLVALGRALADHYARSFGGTLRFASVGRFDQRSRTRPHRDGGPDASLLLLGYEPSAVASTVHLLDYTRAAVDRDLSPAEYLDAFNPAFGDNARLLDSYTEEAAGFDHRRYQVLIVNNGCLPYGERRRGMLGVLHHAVIPTPDPRRSRVIDSVLLGVTDAGLDDDRLEAFVARGTAATA
jgi:hypothetical protein